MRINEGEKVMEEEKQEEIKEEVKEKKKKKKVKIKTIILIPIIIVLLVIVGIGSFFGYKYYEKDTVRKIKKAYHEKVLTTKDAKLYDKKNKIIGTISKNYSLELEKVKKFTIKNKRLRIKDSDYYISFKDIKENKNKEEEKVEENYYLPIEKGISINKEVNLYDGKKKIVTLKKLDDVNVVKMDDKNYYVYFLNKTLSLKKDKAIKEHEIVVDYAVPKAEHVSVIYYDKINNDCGGDDTCLIPASVKAHLKRLKKEGYYFITKEDYINYLKGYIYLKDKAVFIAVGAENDNTKAINDELKANISKVEEKDGIKLTVTNKTSSPKDEKDKVNCYQAKKYIIIDKYVTMASGADTPDNGRENSTNQSVPVLNYHFFYDETIPGERQACNESICLEKKKLESHLKWLKDNGYKTLTIEEFADWYDGIIEIPDKSVLLTIDDGAHGTGKHNGHVLIPLLEQYEEHATLFLIAGWWDINNYKSDYLDIQSHSFNLHYEASCPDGRGLVACSDYATVKKDLQQSLDVIKDNTSFCFPFYSYDNESIQAIKELGFRVSFVGGSVNARRSNNRYLIPRYPIMEDITLNEFINMVR